MTRIAVIAAALAFLLAADKEGRAHGYGSLLPETIALLLVLAFFYGLYVIRWWKVVVAVVTISAAVGSVPIFLYFWCFYGYSIEEWKHRRTFNGRVWKGQQVTDYNYMWPPRLCMVDDLLASGRWRCSRSASH